MCPGKGEKMSYYSLAEIVGISVVALVIIGVIVSIVYSIKTDPKSTIEMKDVCDAKECRFKVDMVAKFDDNLAYDGIRGIYVIVDKQTKKEYVGVSGIGISELGSHHVLTGKSEYTVRDER